MIKKNTFKVCGSMTWILEEIFWTIAIGPKLFKALETLGGRQTKSSRQTGTISCIKVVLKTDVLLWSSLEISCLEDFNLVGVIEAIKSAKFWAWRSDKKKKSWNKVK